MPESDRLSDRFQEVAEVITKGDQLNKNDFTGGLSVLRATDRPSAKNTTPEEKEGGKNADRAITPITSCPKPSDIKEDKVIAFPDREEKQLSDRPPGDQKPNWTKAIFAAVSEPVEPEVRENETPGAEVDRWEVGDQVRIVRVDEKSDRHLTNQIGEVYQLAITGLRIRVGDFRITCDPSNVNKLIAPDQVVNAEVNQLIAPKMTESQQTAVSVQNRPTPYHPRTNPPKKGDRIRCKDGIPGEIVAVRLINPKYELLWENGRTGAYDFQYLEILDIRRED